MSFLIQNHGGFMVKQIGNDDYVWYVAYGSNLSSRRFKRYLEQMPGSPSIPESRPFSIPYNIYFDRNSSQWQNQGVSFLNPIEKGFAYGRAYLLTWNQFTHLQRLEAWYPSVVKLGLIDNIPAVTFTQDDHTHRVPPSDAYLDEIIIGLQETYPKLTFQDCNTYLLNRVKGLHS